MADRAPSAELTTCQARALDMLEREGNIFLTGAAGTGKSFLLNRYLAGKSTDVFPVVASTGAAAVLIGGRTFHSFFGLGIMEGGVEATVARAMRSPKLVRRLLAAACVVIDEISMLSGSTLQAAERVARAVRGRDEVWGGLRIIAVGDFAQLPPVTPSGQMKDWAFLHPVWHDSQFQPALLSTVMRTRDGDFLDVLNLVRAGVADHRVQAFLEERLVRDGEAPEGTRLYAHRHAAEAYNLTRLAELVAEERAFPTVYEGSTQAVEAAKKSMPVPDVLLLKTGALVMMRKNDPSEERLYVNGSLGHVREIADDVLTIALLSGGEIEVERQKFSTLDGDGRELAAAWNFPVSLAWATTIHKAQGASLDSLIADLSSLWEPGQAYVAMSRVRSGAGLRVERWSASSIRAEPLVTNFYDSLAVEMERYVPRPFFAPIEAEAEREPEEGESYVRTMVRASASKAKRRTADLLVLVRERATLQEMAAATGYKPDRLPIHLEKLLKQGEMFSLHHLVEDVPSLGTIREAFETCGLAKLKPVYDYLREEVDYDTLRLVRCAMLAEQAA